MKKFGLYFTAALATAVLTFAGCSTKKVSSTERTETREVTTVEPAPATAVQPVPSSKPNYTTTDVDLGASSGGRGR